ncbi:hypothetical protein JW960_17490 [candidate division KSB1 bacterium]|nr:hypothetical protein [candidate division KSB1 bacterium]
MNWLGIINPFSGGRSGKRTVDRIQHPFKELIAEFQFTSFPGHAREIARTSHHFDGIAVFGGDGTVFEVLNGMDIDQQSIAHIPFGTGNTFARTLGLYDNKNIVDSFHAGKTRQTDLLKIDFKDDAGNFHQYYAACSIAIGYPARATMMGNKYFKSLGDFCYPTACTIAPFFNKPFPAHLNYNEAAQELKFITMLVVNNTSYAGKFLLFPNAVVDDGYFDIAESNAGFFKQNVHNIAVFSKTYFYDPSHIRKAHSLTIELESPHSVMIDGEIFSSVLNIKITILPHVLSCLVN